MIIKNIRTWNWFYQRSDISRLQINFHRGALSWFGRLLNLFSCVWASSVSHQIFGYISINCGRLTIAEWNHIENRLQQTVSSSKGKLLSLGRILVPINLVLNNMVLHMISIFQLPKGVLPILDLFLWQGDREKNRLCRWNVVCRPKYQRGLRIHDL